MASVLPVILYHQSASSSGRNSSSLLDICSRTSSHQSTVQSAPSFSSSIILHGSHPWASVLKTNISSPTRGEVVVASVRDHHRAGRRIGRTLHVNHSFSIRSSPLPSHCSSSPSNWAIHSCRSSVCHPHTVPLNSTRSCGASDLGCSSILTPLIPDIKKVPTS